MSKVPVATATPMPNGSTQVSVVAPMDLQEGYQLEVSVNGANQTVTVPSGGVKEGQSFTSLVSEQSGGGKGHNIPSGKWRDGLCDCFNHGCCNVACWMGWCCEPILAGQVMTRMSRNFLGSPGARPSASNTCMIVTAIFITVAIIQGIFRIVAGSVSCYGVQEVYENGTTYLKCPDGKTMEYSSTYQAIRWVSSVIGILFWLWFLIALCNTRKAIRDKYNIAPSCCGGCDDCCCACWCGCCTTCQMARHTNDYNQYDPACCSPDCCNKRGQPEEVPEIV